MTGFAAGLFTPIYAIFVQDIGGNVLAAGIASSIFAITSGIFIYSLGRVRYFISHVPLFISIGYALLAIGMFGYLLVDTPQKLFLLEVLFGIAVGILEPSWDGLYSSRLSAHEATRAWSTYTGLQSIGTGVSALLGGFIVASFSFKVLFLMMGAIDVIALIIALRVAAEK